MLSGGILRRGAVTNKDNLDDSSKFQKRIARPLTTPICAFRLHEYNTTQSPHR